MRKIMLFLAIAFTAGTAFATTGTCATKNPPAAPAGWTYKGKPCKNETASCGRLCLCATSQATNFRTKTVTFTCACRGPNKVDLVDVDGVPETGMGLFTYTLSPYILEDFLAEVLGIGSGDGLGPEVLAGMTAGVQLILTDGSVVEAFSEPLAGGSFELGIQVPAVSGDQVEQYVFFLGNYTEEGVLPASEYVDEDAAPPAQPIKQTPGSLQPYDKRRSGSSSPLTA